MPISSKDRIIGYMIIYIVGSIKQTIMQRDTHGSLPHKVLNSSELSALGLIHPINNQQPGTNSTLAELEDTV